MPYPYNYNGYPYNYNQQMQQPAAQQLVLIRASQAEAYNYPMVPNTTLGFTDGQRIFIKTTSNSPTGDFSFETFVREMPQKQESPDYLTRTEFEAFKASLKPSEVKTGE